MEFVYANETNLLNVALSGMIAKQWRIKVQILKNLYHLDL